MLRRHVFLILGVKKRAVRMDGAFLCCVLFVFGLFFVYRLLGRGWVWRRRPAAAVYNRRRQRPQVLLTRRARRQLVMRVSAAY